MRIQKYYVKDLGWNNWAVCQRVYNPDYQNPVNKVFDSKQDAQNYADILTAEYDEYQEYVNKVEAPMGFSDWQLHKKKFDELNKAYQEEIQPLYSANVYPFSFKDSLREQELLKAMNPLETLLGY